MGVFVSGSRGGFSTSSGSVLAICTSRGVILTLSYFWMRSLVAIMKNLQFSQNPHLFVCEGSRSSNHNLVASQNHTIHLKIDIFHKSILLFSGCIFFRSTRLS